MLDRLLANPPSREQLLIEETWRARLWPDNRHERNRPIRNERGNQ
jgi:hypothetical protein